MTEKAKSLETARAVRSANRRDRQDREVLVQRLTDLAVAELDCEPEDVEITFRGASLTRPMIHVRDPKTRVARAYTLSEDA